MALQSIKTIAALAALALTGVASAGISNFTMVGGTTVPGLDVSMTVQESTNAKYQYDFVITNNSDIGSVTGVYFEKGWKEMLKGSTSDGSADLKSGTKKPEIDGWEGTRRSYTVRQHNQRTAVGRYMMNSRVDKVEDGLAPGQTQIFSFKIKPKSTPLGDIEDMIGLEMFGIAIRIQDMGGDPQAAGWGLAEPMIDPDPITDDNGQPPVTGVPSPTAAFAGLVMMGIAGMRRRRA